VHTGFTVIDRAAQPAAQRIEGVESTKVRFLALSAEQIDRYVASGEPLDKAGAYGVQGLGALFVWLIGIPFPFVLSIG